MKEDRLQIDQLRALSKISHKERTWISQLSDKRINEIYIKLRAGESARSIARHVQQVWKINPASSVHSLAQGINKFRSRISSLLTKSQITSNNTISEHTFHESGDASTLVRMETIARETEARIRRMINEENNTGVKYPYLNRDIQALANLRKSIIKQKDWEIHHRVSIQEEQERQVREGLKTKFDHLMNLLGDDGQERLIHMMHRFLEEVEKIAVPMRQGTDGIYRPFDGSIQSADYKTDEFE